MAHVVLQTYVVHNILGFVSKIAAVRINSLACQRRNYATINSSFASETDIIH